MQKNSIAKTNQNEPNMHISPILFLLNYKDWLDLRDFYIKDLAMVSNIFLFMNGLVLFI